jgi:CobQ-like glutamine amidotransferase family enzyme
VTPIRIVPLYPDLLSIYADRGNVRVLEQRAGWHGLDAVVAPVGLGEPLDPGLADVILIGGGQDRDQSIVAEELVRLRPAIREALAEGAALLAVCGGYQMLGHRYLGHHGDDIPGLGVVDLETFAGDTRVIGNIAIECELDGRTRTIVGFENHAGRTVLGNVEPLGRVLAGGGNTGDSGYEGCRSGRVLGTYIHGPLLPKNPWIADLLLSWALDRRGLPSSLTPLDDDLEDLAAAGAIASARRERRG